MAEEHGAVHRIGCRISAAVAKFSADPLAQVGFILLCVAWFAVGWNVNVLTAALSILAITLTQMVLNSQGERERDAHRRDVALHAKLDELLLASRRARDELAGIEELEEEEIEQLRNGGPPMKAARREVLSGAAST
jgi:low affinity Fe/Cu permease